MSGDSLSIFSKRMATAALWLCIAMLIVNAAVWLFPILGSAKEGYGIAFSLSDRLIASSDVKVHALIWWQRVGAILLSSIPLAALTAGLVSLRSLFRGYAAGHYFSVSSSADLERVGRSVMLWVALDLICEPLLSGWLTVRQPAGERFISVSFQFADVIAIFLAICVILIARILRRASAVDAENRQFV